MNEIISGISSFSLRGWVLSQLKNLSLTILGCSYYICLTVCIVSIFLYIIGIKKAGKYTTGSLITYFILEGFKTILL